MQKVTKVVTWVLVGLVSVSLWVVVLGIWGRGRTDYAFPDGDLPAHLAGRWDWSTEAHPCGPSAHVISFADDRRTMTLSKAASGADTGWTATYDILELSPSGLRGAIRGESRRTEAGVPVVWDLIMFGPDEYAWHRTDWGAWEYTPTVRRCGVTNQ